MLCQFSITNFKSIREKITFDMQAVPITEHKDSLMKGFYDEKYLPISVLYGPNGGGKTNVLEGLFVLIQKVLKPIYSTILSNSDVDYTSAICPFKFNSIYQQKPTEFELYFSTDQREYKYEIHVVKEDIVFEKLSCRTQNQQVDTLFERDEKDICLQGPLEGLYVSEHLSSTIPLLSLLAIAYGNNKIVNEVIGWFLHKIDFLNFGNTYKENKSFVACDPKLRGLMLKMIQEMDLDIVDYRIEEQEHHGIEIYTKHRVNQDEFELNLKQESNGTKKLFQLLPYVSNSLLNGSVLIIDELDAKIHPILLDYIIHLYNTKDSNTKGAQLIFTSHDLSTMNGNNFRRDEIWFVAKGNEENSVLYSLVEFKTKNGLSVRKDAKYNKQYLEGKYGADPYLKKIIDWSMYNG